MRRRSFWIVVLPLALTVPGSTIPCERPTPFAAERATMQYIATLTVNWERRSRNEFVRVATRQHRLELGHPADPARAIFSPYLMDARFDRIETRCRGATVDMTVSTGFKPAFTIPRAVRLELALEDRQLKVAEVIGR